MAKETKNPFRNSAAERTLLATVFKHGKDALIDAQAYVTSSDFALPINRAVYKCLEELVDDPKCDKFDAEAVKMKAQSAGLGNYISTPKELEYLELLEAGGTDKDNIPMFGMQIKKYSVVRDLYQRYQDAQNSLLQTTGNEDLSEIIRKAENNIVDFVTGIDGAGTLETLGDDIEDHVKMLIESEPVNQVGLPTGFELYDEAIGGGPRRGTISVIGARPKTGKSFMAMNIARNLARRNIPVLYLDTEMTKVYEQDRLIAMDAQCPLWALETRNFNRNRDLVTRVQNSAQAIKKMPFHYQSISGMSHTEALALARRWLVRHVGFNEKGQANDCAIIYDYMKLTSGANLTKVTPEYIVLGLMLTEMHNFAVKYNVPIIGFVQLNREGIDNVDTSIIAGSDRILWLCSSMSVLRNKNADDEALDCGFPFGNKKLSILETRQGSGLEQEGDYINLKASLRPMVTKEEATGLIVEGMKYSQVSQVNQYANRTQENQPSHA